jgi:DNA-directed RNA polymerase specialized sigma24 family protein
MKATFLTPEWHRSMQHKLLRYFVVERCPDPQNCADETICRVVNALSKGAIIEVNPATFTYAVARLVEMECRRTRQKRRESQFTETTPEPVLHDNSVVELQHLLLESCMEKLSPYERVLIIKYHEGALSGEDKRNRKALAERLGISIKKLRKEAIKIRAKLEKCIAESLDHER